MLILYPPINGIILTAKIVQAERFSKQIYLFDGRISK